MKCIADGKDQKNEEKEERLHGPILIAFGYGARRVPKFLALWRLD